MDLRLLFSILQNALKVYFYLKVLRYSHLEDIPFLRAARIFGGYRVSGHEKG